LAASAPSGCRSPSPREVRLTKTLSLSYPPDEQSPGEVLTIGKDLLRPSRALKVGCADIRRRLFPNGLPTSYIEGFVVIESFGSIDVNAVYISRDVAKAPDCDERPGGGGHADVRTAGARIARRAAGTVAAAQWAAGRRIRSRPLSMSSRFASASSSARNRR